MSKSPHVKGTFSFVTLGCPKNLVDSERMLGLLAQDGYVLVSDTDSADLVVINTCGFIDTARRESMGVIEEMLERKRAGAIKGVVVAGCLAEREKDRILEEVPEIDQVVGVFGREEIAKVADRILGGVHEQRTVFRPAPIQALDDRARLRITPRHLAFLKVSEGCDRPCTFCAIPGMRGKHVSKPIEAIVAEARELAADGVRELNLVAQDMTYYGLDLYGQPQLAALLRKLDQVDGIDWVRILYCYPQHFTDELFEVLGSAQKILPYLDMPLQHANDRILKRMSRRHTKEGTTELLHRLRTAIPNLVLRTTFLVGFPGETEAEFEELVVFVQEQRFERMGVFPYSFEPGTPSAKLPDHLPEEVKIERRDRLMAAQQPITFAFGAAQVGQVREVLIDGPGPEPGTWAGRTYADAPEIDGQVFVAGDHLEPGDLITCEIARADGYDLIAEAPLVAPPRRHRGRARSRKGPAPAGPFPIL